MAPTWPHWPLPKRAAADPECEHLQGDMRELRIDRTFDAVFVHDAIAYMTTEEDLFSHDRDRP
jgi:hypothetical protein